MRERNVRFVLVLILFILICCGCSPNPAIIADDGILDQAPENKIVESGSYTTPEDVAEYIHLYNKLPGNFITKNEALARGWKSSQGNL